MILKVNLLSWGVALISAGVSSKTAIAFVPNCQNFRRGQMSAATVSSGTSFLTPLLLSNTNQAEDADPDLFDYFDPLLSPHAYPSGISPEKKTQYQSNDEVQEERQRSPQNFGDSASKGQFGFRLSTEEQTDEENPSPPSSTKGDFGFKILSNDPTDRPVMEQEDSKQDEDLFDYFDPLRSPHEYPDGIKSNKELESSVATPSALEVVDDSLGRISRTNTISNGKKKKVGVLLMDHGSRKEKSNARLQKMAELYQMTLGTDDDEVDENAPTIIVRAAHMEIALPSIPDGLKDLRDQGVDEIICHPFFLSADGRHVKEDIPEIIGKAIDDLWGEASGATPIPVVTTAPVGSNTQLMLGAIHSLVRENSQFMKTTLQNE